MRRSPAQEPRDREEQEQAGQNGSCDHHQDVRIIEVSGRDHHGPGNISLCRSEPEHGAAFRTAEQKSHGKGSRDEQDRSRYRTTPHYPDQVMEIGAEGGENHPHERDSRQLAAIGTSRAAQPGASAFTTRPSTMGTTNVERSGRPIAKTLEGR